VGEENIEKLEKNEAAKSEKRIYEDNKHLIMAVGNIVMVQENYESNTGWKMANLTEEILETLRKAANEFVRK